MTNPNRVAVIGLSDAGLRLARQLADAGADVVGFDVKPPSRPEIPLAASIADAVAGADVVIAINLPSVSLRVAEQAAPHLREGAIYVDFNTGIPTFKERLAAVFPEGAFVDGAALLPRDETGTETLMLAGPAAAQLGEQFAPLGLPVEVVSEQVGAAAGRVLTRSILSKAIAGVVIDYLWAAEAMGLTEWAYDELLREFDAMTADTAKRLILETVDNPKRREIEMLDIVEMLDHADYHSIFVPPTQLIYNKLYHSIKVPFGTADEQAKRAAGDERAAAEW